MFNRAFDIRHDEDAAVVFDLRGFGITARRLASGAMPMVGLSGFCGADQPPDIIQAQAASRHVADVKMALHGPD